MHGTLVVAVHFSKELNAPATTEDESDDTMDNLMRN